MLPGELLQKETRGGVTTAYALEANRANLELAGALIETFADFQGLRRGDLDEALLELEGTETDFKTRRGLAHLLYGDRCEFTVQPGVDPGVLRARAFKQAAKLGPSRANTAVILEGIALELTGETGAPISSEQLESALYADLKANQIIAFDKPTPEWLINRFNVAQAQGVLYRASEVTITARRNEPGQYKILFKYLKLFGLMHKIGGDPNSGYTITLDGPSSLFKHTTQYGIRFAAFLPAMLHVTKWNLEATLQIRDADGKSQESTFTLDSSTALKSHYPPGKTYDSMLEVGFAERFAKLETGWTLEREVELVDLGGTVIIPDFRLVHADGRAVLLEIVGFWRRDYLQRKFSRLRASGRTDIIIAVSERLNLGEVAKAVDDLEGQIIRFKGILDPKRVLELAERFGPA